MRNSLFSVCTLVTVVLILMLFTVYTSSTTSHIICSTQQTTSVPASTRTFLSPPNCCSRNHSSCEIEPLISLSDRACPDRYLAFNHYGNLSNAIIQLSQAIYLASVLDRTVLLTPELSINWQKSLEISNFCVRIVNETELKLLLEESGQRTVKAIHWDDNAKHLQRPVAYPIEWIRLDGDYLKREASDDEGYLRLNCVASSLPQFPDRIISIPRPFYLGRTKEAHLRILKHLKPGTKHQRKVADDFLADKLGGKQFVAVHLRWFEGLCEPFNTDRFGRLPTLINYLSQSREACDMKWEYISRLMMQARFDPKTTPIYLATDNQRPSLTRNLTRHRNVFMWDPAYKDSSIDARIIDLYILTKSALLIAHPVSSFAFNAAMWRELNGWGPETNALPAYRETGYLAHLFHFYEQN
jgi:hypothetical protein